MRTRIIEERIYKFNELSANAKQAAKDWWLQGQEPCWFSSDCKEWLKGDFPNSNLDVSYELGYCQGDHFTIFGRLDFQDAWKRINRSEFSEKEIRFMDWILEKVYSYFDIETTWRNQRSDYSDMMIDMQYDIEYAGYKNVRWKTLEKFHKSVQDHMKSLEAQFMNWGYDFFYEISDEDMEDVCEANGYEFYEDGSVA